MQTIRIWAGILCAVAFAAACADAPTAPAPTTARGVGPGVAGPSNTIVLDPVIVIGEPECDPWQDANWCEGDDGGVCMSSTESATPGPEMVSTEGCNTGGGSGPGSGGTVTPYNPDSSDDPPTAYEEGPLAWGACVLAVLGSAYSIDQVAGAFMGWWEAQREYESVQRTYDAVVANPESTTSETIQLWEFRLTYARDQRDAAMASVTEKTGASYWALGAAAVSCGVAAFLPTP